MRKNKQTIYKRNLLICILLLFYSIVSPLTYGRTRESLLKPMWQNYCIFEGMLESRENEQVGDRWHKEFDMLKENNTPNFLAMQNILADLVIVPKEEVLKCPKLQNYLSELVNYTESNANYDKISDNIRQVIDYIKWHKLAENTDQSPYHLNIIQAEDQINKNKNDEPPKSIDNNNYHWESCNKYLDNLRINTIHSAYGIIFAGTDAGIYSSNDSGKSWQAMNKGLNQKPRHTDIDTIYSNNGVLYTGTRPDGIYQSKNKGKTWKNISKNFPKSAALKSLLITKNAFYAGTFDGVFISTNKGKDWHKSDNGLTGYDPFLSSTEQINDLHVLNNNLFAGTSGGVFRRIDCKNNRQDSWLGHKVAKSLLSISSVLYSETFDERFTSTDCEEIWQDFRLRHKVVESICSIGSALYAGTSDGVFKSSDYGLNWFDSSQGLNHASINDLLVIDDILYASSFAKGVFKSSDKGEHWELIEELPETYVRSLCTHDKTLYVGTDNGIFKLTSVKNTDNIKDEL